MKFAFPTSPYISTLGIFHVDTSFVSFDPEKLSCVMMQMNHVRFELSEMAGNELFEALNMVRIEWRFDDQRIGDINIYCALPPPLAAPHGPRAAWLLAD